ncbi:hypothetical protein ACH5RR_015015 [Cinchona calisaya]|uniref:FBD domain-containing protein n=1 Tax=Cinchona calisaya TaxID=153742 RepID=A0ABD2ZRY1_9GENT
MERDGLLCLTLACKSLILNLSENIDREDLYGIVNVLESSPNLEALTIIMRSAKSPQFCDWKKRHGYPKLKGSSHCLRQHLKTVRVINLVEKAHESEFLKYLLENGKMLEKMLVEVSKGGGEGRDISQLKQQLLSFPRASSRAMILFS